MFLFVKLVYFIYVVRVQEMYHSHAFTFTKIAEYAQILIQTQFSFNIKLLSFIRLWYQYVSVKLTGQKHIHYVFLYECEELKSYI